MPQYGSIKRHPLTSLLLLILLFLTCYIVFAFIAFFLASLMYGKDILAIAAGDVDTGMLRLIQGVTSAGSFILPPLILSWTERKYGINYFGNYKNASVQLILLTVVIMFVSSPFLEWTIRINQNMHLPEFLRGLENWMREKEDQLENMTKQLLTMNSISDFLINLLIIALIPAIGEELVFRGGVQNIFSRWTGNYHLGIWIAAILFSAIHVQFFGFIPRMLLGALFGYLFVWSRSIWIPVLAHFINNGTAVTGAYFLQRKGKSLEELDKIQDNSSPYMVVVSIVFASLILWAFYTYRTKTNLIDEQNG